VITIVSGLPRSGTSLMMQMLAAGGLPVLTDGVRVADEDNPRGYFEWERIRTLPRDPQLIGEAEGRVVKTISSLLRFLPPNRSYNVIFMRRPLGEVVASQAAMIARRKTSGPALDREAMVKALQTHLQEVAAWLATQPNLRVLWIEHAELLHDPALYAAEIIRFLGLPLNVEAMAAQMDRSLHRQTGRSQKP